MNMILARLLVPLSVIKPSSTALLPPDNCAPWRIVESIPALKYSVLASSVPCVTSK